MGAACQELFPPLLPPHPIQTKNAYLGSSEEQGLNIKREKGDDRQENTIS